MQLKDIEHKKESKMNYLFFDTECAARINGVPRICSFGYVLCDEEYNILEKNDILINPRCDFDTENLSHSGIKFAYPEEDFFASPDFRHSYCKIRKLLSRPDTLIIGHATGCDASYILQNIRENGLSYYDFTYLDTQKLFKEFKGDPAVSLPNLCKHFGIEVLTEHKSDDDAEMTAYCTKALCSKLGYSIIDASKKPELLGAVHNGELHSSLSAAFPIGDGYKMTALAHKNLRAYLDSELKELTPNVDFVGKRYCFDEHFEHNNFTRALFLIHRLRLIGAIYDPNVVKCDIFVEFPAAPAVHNGRREIAKSLHRQIISSDKLLKQLNISRIPENAEIDCDSIFGATEDGYEWYGFYTNKLFE